MKKFMPIIISIIVTAVVSSGATYAILNISDDDKGETNAQVKVEVENEEPEAEFEIYELDGAPQTNESETDKLKIDVEIKSAKKTQSYGGKPAVIITYVYTNLGDSADQFNNWRDINVYQNGVALEDTYSFADNYELKGDENSDVKPGSSAEIELGYLLNDETTDLLVEVRDGFSYNYYVFARTFTME